MSNLFLSIIIPAYNEERRIGKTLSELDEYLRKQSYTFEVLVISDGSTDGTVKVVESFMRSLSGLRVIALPENAGKGAAVQRGMLSACADIRLFMDADGATSITELDRLLPHLRTVTLSKGSDIVIGSLGVPGAVMLEKQSRLRMTFGRLSNLLIQWVVLPGIYDTQRGFKLFTKEATEALFPLLTIQRWGFDIELLGLARRLGFCIAEVPIQWKHISESKVTPFSYAQVLADLFLIKWRLSRVQKQTRNTP